MQSNFIDIPKILDIKELQLIYDMDTRWSLTFLMINRALKLKKVYNIRFCSLFILINY
jgi:hypothetical protein